MEFPWVHRGLWGNMGVKGDTEGYGSPVGQRGDGSNGGEHGAEELRGPRGLVGHSPVGGGGHHSHFPFQGPPDIRGTPPGESPQSRSPHSAPHCPAPPHGLCPARGGAGRRGREHWGGREGRRGGAAGGRDGGRGSRVGGSGRNCALWGGQRGNRGAELVQGGIGAEGCTGGMGGTGEILGRGPGRILGGGGGAGNGRKVTGGLWSAPGRAGLRSASFGRFRRRSGTSGPDRLGSGPLGRGMAPPAGDVSRELQGTGAQRPYYPKSSHFTPNPTHIPPFHPKPSRNPLIFP